MRPPNSENNTQNNNDTNDMDALTLLNCSVMFDFASDKLKEAISKLMKLEQVEGGYHFIEEGDEINKFFIVQDGALQRYKLGDDHDKENMTIEERYEHSVLLDTVEGQGRVTGIFHNLQPGLKAFATITSNGPAKVWSVDGQEFRDLLLNNGGFAMEVMSRMAERLRSVTKVSRALMKSSTSATNYDGEASPDNKMVLKVMCYDTTEWVRNGFIPAITKFNAAEANKGKLELRMDFIEDRLSTQSAAYASGYNAICTFVNDTADTDVLRTLSMLGVKMIAQRSAGFDRIDTKSARTFGLTVARVPAYSPYAVAEMAISLLMSVNRKVTRANNRVKMANFTLDEGLMGMDIHGKTVGVMGTGKIGQILCNIILGFGAKLICYDVFESDAVKAAGGKYVTKNEILEQSDIIFLMMPLLPPTKHTINMGTLPKLKKGVIIINTSRGGLIDTKALLEGLKTGQIGGCGLDVYENEQDYFFQDWSARRIPDVDLVALLGNHNVVLTAHQAFFTKEAVDKIISTTIDNLRDFASGKTGFDHPNNCIPVPK